MSESSLVPARPRPADLTRLPPAPTIRPEAMPSPIEKAAVILTAIGPELASGILRSLSEPEMVRFARAIGGLGRVPQDVLDAVIMEFLDLLTTGPELSGGAQAARRLLSAVVDDEDEVQRLLDGRRKADGRSVWEQMNQTPAPPIATFLQAEHPQTAAVVLSELRPEVAAGVLERLDRGFAQAVVLRLSRVPTLDAPVAAAIKGAIDGDFLSVLQRNLSKRRPADMIASLMNNISTEVREGFLNFLEAQDAFLAQDVQRIMFTFDDIALRIASRDVAGVIRDIPEETLLKAMKHGLSLGSPAVGFILDNLPRRLSERYVEDLGALRDVPRKEGELAQIEITKAIQAQVKAGAVRLLDKDPGPA
ncbi:flagellar motor switch protein FliG [Amaricoccus macauensis]|uniref:Flagellar motor switch protein FliG n=1 Tax=Amaricoccus macauensis TaxID=57001 RepID=A0A840SG48_9RHOB|nr:FliG C-terminal domain-containing protein [Amaricoccus macauensis]MBB5220837.1 flagellar motor switch protein FliG [Amaricoccus macauensis]